MIVKTTSAIAVLAIAGSALANPVTLGSQDFNVLDASDRNTFDTFATSGVLTNASSFNNGGPGLDFVTRWFNTRGNSGPNDPASESSGDFIGVADFTGISFSEAPDFGPTGIPVSAGVEQNYQFNDGDGLLQLDFEDIDVTGFTDLTVSFDAWIADTGYESDDEFSAAVFGGSGDPIVLFSWSEVELEANVGNDNPIGSWVSFSFNVSDLGFDGTSLDFRINADTNSSGENIIVDNILVTGVPTPGAAALAGIAGLAATRRRRSA